MNLIVLSTIDSSGLEKRDSTGKELSLRRTEEEDWVSHAHTNYEEDSLRGWKGENNVVIE